MVPALLYLMLYTVAAKQDCIPGDWSDWSNCDERCGATGKRQRDRKIEVLPTSDGRQCSELDFVEEGRCNRFCYHGGSMLITKCDCRTGWSGTCCEIDINECNNANAGCQQQCVNRDGGFRCLCWDGFLMNEVGACEDVDECDKNGDHYSGCQGACMNYPGGFSCACLPPKVLEMDRVTCAKENYCVTDPMSFNCTEHCVVHNNAFYCNCPEGYELDQATYKCIHSDECRRPGYCESGTCMNVEGTAHCECGAGRGLDENGLKCIDVDECKTGTSQCSHTCKNVNAGHVCLCPVNMVIGKDHKTCEDENECLREPSPCSHSCNDIVGGYICKCPKNMELESDKRTCCDIGKCMRPLSEIEGNKTQNLIIWFSVAAVLVVLVLAILIWRTLRRTIRSNEKVVRAIQHSDVYYNPRADMELETRGSGLAAATRAEPYNTFTRRNIPQDEEDKSKHI